MSTFSPATRLPVPRSADAGRRAIAGVLSALVVATVALIVASLALFVSHQQLESAFSAGISFFWLPGLIAALLLAVFNVLGATRLWLAAFAGGVVAGIIGAVLGPLLRFAIEGNPVTADVWTQAFGSVLGISLIFIIAVVIGEVTLGRDLYARIVRPREETERERRIALVRVPAENLADGQVTHIERSAIDAALADEQWDNYCLALTAEGWDVREVDPEPALADGVFIEDAVVFFGDLAVVTSPGSPARRGEIASVERAVAELGIPSTAHILLPGTLDGGDVLKVGSTVYVGRSTRTNAEGIRQLRVLLDPLGYTVVAVPLTRALHLKSAATALPDGTVIGYRELFDDITVFDRFIEVPEEGGAHVVVLAPDTVLMASSAPVSAALIADLGYRVVTVDISEFEKLEGCVTCLSVRVR